MKGPRIQVPRIKVPCAQRGTAIIIAMLVLALAVAGAAAMLERQDLDARALQSQRDYEQARWMLRGGMHWARSILAEDARAGASDHRRELWASGLPPTDVQLGSLAGEIRDEQGLFNLNNLLRGGKPDPLQIAALGRLLGAIGLSPALADAIAARINPQRPLADVGELAGLGGLDANALGRLRLYATALPRPTAVNINTAPAEVLVAIVEGLALSEAQALARRLATDPVRNRERVPGAPAAGPEAEPRRHFRLEPVLRGAGAGQGGRRRSAHGGAPAAHGSRPPGHRLAAQRMSICRVRLGRDFPESGRFEWALVNELGSVLESGVSDLAMPPRGRPCEAVLAAELVLLERVALPAAQQRRLQSALRFLAEDSIVPDPARVHVAAARTPQKDVVCVGVVDREWFAQALARLARAGVAPVAAYPETLLPPLEAGAWVVACNGDESFVRTGEAEGFALDSAAEDEPPVALAPGARGGARRRAAAAAPRAARRIRARRCPMRRAGPPPWTCRWSPARPGAGPRRGSARASSSFRVSSPRAGRAVPGARRCGGPRSWPPRCSS